MEQMEKSSAIFVAGHKGLVGSSLVRRLRINGYNNLILKERAELDLLDASAVDQFFAKNKIDFVFHAAGKVGGIVYNSNFQADFLYENLTIGTSVIHAAANSGVKKLLYLGSSCIYPKFAPQPIKEESLLTGALEPTNEGYAIAKIASLKLCEKYNTQYGKRFISAMPTSLYGPGDKFDPQKCHVIPALMRRFHQAKLDKHPQVSIWGTGAPRREFLYIDDLAEALILLMQRYEEPTTINVGTGTDCTIKELAQKIKETVKYEGEIVFDHSKPDGTPRKVLNVDRINALGWSANTDLSEGLAMAYLWALENRVFE